MNRRGLEISIRKLKLISELDSRNLLREQVVIKIQEDLATEILESFGEDSSPDELLGILQQTKEQNEMSSGSATDAFTVFVCYAHNDNQGKDPRERWLDRLLVHIQPLVLQKQVTTWSDKEIEAGTFWHESIQIKLQNAKAAVLLVSPYFLASEYIRNSELPILLKNAKDKGVIILPVILGPCLFKEIKFKYPDPTNGPEELSLSSLQAANSPDTPLSGMSVHEQDQALLSVAQRLYRIVQPNP